MRLPFPLQEAALYSEAQNYASSPISVIFEQIVRVGQQKENYEVHAQRKKEELCNRIYPFTPTSAINPLISPRNKFFRSRKGGGGKEVWLLVILALEERSAGGVDPRGGGGVYGKLGPRDHVTEAAEFEALFTGLFAFLCQGDNHKGGKVIPN
ncbi:hypothetical protein CEXT_797171 [Caerostris extrusa]|uniref:Uncharacterized protein n=1 Tax=Caerostris extrusa TaxID=172846 RepID=A0AAV4R9E0_CAEEX|nr:hypothetical protein CEXT_797171 [Caerostris extrusa]